MFTAIVKSNECITCDKLWEYDTGRKTREGSQLYPDTVGHWGCLLIRGLPV